MASHSFACRSVLKVRSQEYEIFRLDSVAAIPGGAASLSRLPFTHRILLENLLRHPDTSAQEIEQVVRFDPRAEPAVEIAFRPARVLMQDFTGVPAVVDLAAMRDAVLRLGGDPARINPLEPAELVIDHSVQVDEYGGPGALAANTELEYARNRERYTFLRWGQRALRDLTVVPPGTGIVHQVNLERLARVVATRRRDDGTLSAFPDTLVGTDSHTTMINGLGVLGWGVGGIEAEAAMLGQPVSMLLPQVVGFRLEGCLAAGVTATDLVLTVTEMLRKKGVVGRFVEFFGPGVSRLPLADRATIANMAPEYGATCGYFPVDGETLRYLRESGRSREQVELVEAYTAEQGLLLGPSSPVPAYTDTLALDLGEVAPCIAGPRRPQDRLPLAEAGRSFQQELATLLKPGARPDARATLSLGGTTYEVGHGGVAIAAITSCTNTSNPSVMLAAGLLARRAVERGLRVKPWVKTSLAPGSRVVTAYLEAAGLARCLDQLGFHTVGYGCTTCIGNSGPLVQEVNRAIEEHGLVLASVLSGNRNFEGRVHPELRANYLMSPPLVVAFALVGRIDVDLTSEPLGTDAEGKPVHLAELWPTPEEIREAQGGLQASLYEHTYGSILEGDQRWRALPVPSGDTYAWEPSSTYIRHPPYFDQMPPEPPAPRDIQGARVLAVLGDSVTTDHISPAGAIKRASPAARYLEARGVEPGDYNSYGSRRGNHEVMMRGTFANVRLRNRLAPDTEGAVTRHLPGGEQMSIFEASERYRSEGVPLLVLAGAEYGTGSSRDWAAKGPALLGVRAVLARSYERIHRSNLVGMGIAPLEFLPGQDVGSRGLTGEESYDVLGIAEAVGGPFRSRAQVTVRATPAQGAPRELRVVLRLDTPQEVQYYCHGGILPYVLRQLLRRG